MPKRKRLFTPNKKLKTPVKQEKPEYGKEVNSARGRLMGALMDVLDPNEDVDSDDSYDPSPSKHERQINSVKNENPTDEAKCNRMSLAKHSYVLKLFDRSVDLSQFREDSPLYPICRAWITNQPKANYSQLGVPKNVEEPECNGVELPGPSGALVTRVPGLLPMSLEPSRDNINFNYREQPPPSKDSLLQQHLSRWSAVRQTWIDQAAKVEARYEATQQILNKLNIDYTR